MASEMYCGKHPSCITAFDSVNGSRGLPPSLLPDVGIPRKYGDPALGKMLRRKNQVSCPHSIRANGKIVRQISWHRILLSVFLGLSDLNIFHGQINEIHKRIQLGIFTYTLNLSRRVQFSFHPSMSVWHVHVVAFQSRVT
jgi:hypothetical protein